MDSSGVGGSVGRASGSRIAAFGRGKFEFAGRDLWMLFHTREAADRCARFCSLVQGMVKKWGWNWRRKGRTGGDK